MIRALPILCLFLFSACRSVIAQEAADGERPPVENIAISLGSEVLRKDLGMTDVQTHQMMMICSRTESYLSTYVGKLESVSADDLMEHQARLRKQMAAFDEEAAEVLLPAQLEKLSRIVASKSHQADNADGGLLQPEMIARLGLSPEQTAELKKKIEEIEPKLEARLKELEENIRREKSVARDSLLKLLTKEQREQYEKLLGQRFGE